MDREKSIGDGNNEKTNEAEWNKKYILKCKTFRLETRSRNKYLDLRMHLASSRKVYLCN